MTKIRSKYSGSIPIPLSATANSTVPSRRSAEIRTSGGTSSRRYLTALPTRFEKTSASWAGSAMTAGRSSAVTVAPASWTTVSMERTTSATTRQASVGTGGRAVVSTRESWSRSSIRRCIRVPASTIKVMNSSASWSSFPV